MRKSLVPLEWSVSLLAGFTILLLVYAKLPIWALFVSWGGTFLLQKPNLEGIKQMWPPLIAGTVFGAIFLALLFTIDPQVGSNAVLVNGIILFVVVLIVMYAGRIPALGLIPVMFFGFASIIGVALGAGASSVDALVAPWIRATIALLLGPVFAWLSIVFTFPSSSAAG